MHGRLPLEEHTCTVFLLYHWSPIIHTKCVLYVGFWLLLSWFLCAFKSLCPPLVNSKILNPLKNSYLGCYIRKLQLALQKKLQMNLVNEENKTTKSGAKWKIMFPWMLSFWVLLNTENQLSCQSKLCFGLSAKVRHGGKI